ncbi:MAG: anti-phage dCTP deaminase [Pseudooceanicola sp.]
MPTNAQEKIPHVSRKDASDQTLGAIQRPTDELVIGLVGAVGAGVSTSGRIIAELLQDVYGYESATIIKISDIIKENRGKVTPKEPADQGAQRIVDLQRMGTELRDRFGDEYLAAKAIEDIGLSRLAVDGYDDKAKKLNPLSLRRVTIIDSLKHQKETELLRETYGGMYWQFTIFAPEGVRETRLTTEGVDKKALHGIFTRDEDAEDDDHGQKVSQTAHLSDFFVRNDGENPARLEKVLGRFLEIIFGIRVHTPNNNESGMYAAVSAASKSACLSRQVGAALFSDSGELLGVGWNDVPTAGGGLYETDVLEEDQRCFNWRDGSCHNDLNKELLYYNVFQRLRAQGLLSSSASQEKVREVLKSTPIKSLIEYSRAIHAEMEAILSVARGGKSNLVGATLFTTTFPCHNCARHIVAAGISTVYYIEPYAKSLAIRLHGDSISMTADEQKVAFLQYEGVGPSVSMKLFQAQGSRKSDGKAIKKDTKKAHPVLPPPLDGFTTHEQRVTLRIKDIEGE